MSSSRFSSAVVDAGSSSRTVAVSLGPERVVDVRRASASDAENLHRWVLDDDCTSPEREKLLADIAGEIFAGEEEPAYRALLIVRDQQGTLVAAAGYRVEDDDACATTVCKVERRYQNLGLGTFLLRRLAEIAFAHGIHSFHVEVMSNALGLSDMLRDCGLRSRWDFGYPASHVDLDLRGSRPGWATPECPTVAPARS